MVVPVESRATEIDQLNLSRQGAFNQASASRILGAGEGSVVSSVTHKQQVLRLQVRVGETKVVKEHERGHQLTCNSLKIADVEPFVRILLEEFIQVLAEGFEHHTEMTTIVHERILESDAAR